MYLSTRPEPEGGTLDPMHRLVLAHEWGWDELLYFGLPVVAVLCGVRWVEKRARQRQQEVGDGAGSAAIMPARDDPPGSEP